MKNMSIWKDYYKETNYESLTQDLDVDVLIIGGGITGVSSLFHLRDSNLKVALVEQNKIGLSVTGNSTGKLNYLQNDLIDKIRSFYDDEVASLYLNSQIESIHHIESVVEEKKIDCDLEKINSYLYTNDDKSIDKMKELEKFLIKNKIEVSKSNHELVDSKYMIMVNDTYIFNPLKFINGLLKDNKFPIYENTSIIKIQKEKNTYICYTKSNKIKAKYVILASHYPYFLKPFLFPMKVSLEKSYLSASLYDIKPFSLISYSNPFISMRTYKNYLIYLSNSHSINKDVCDKDNFNELLKKVNKLDMKPQYLWSNMDIMTSDGLPFIGSLKDNMLIGTGYNTWGLTNGFLAGKILSDIIMKRDNPYISLFSPNRKNSKNIVSYISNTYKNVDGFIKGYLDSSSKYICPHLGCKLIYNEVENTFDCPCHGSRFHKDGKCISGPANKDIDVN